MEHGSILNGNIRPRRISSQWQSTPASFIDVLSEKPSAPEIGHAYYVQLANRRPWQFRAPGLRMGVNLFQAQFRDGRLPSVVEEVLTETRLPAAALELEIVEYILLRNDEATLQLLQTLREIGVGLAFDDYGTGYASLSLLKRYPVTRLKIDRSFIRDVTVDPEDAAVVKAIIYLCRSFGMEVIAEGVETQEQYDFLKRENAARFKAICSGTGPCRRF